VTSPIAAITRCVWTHCQVFFDNRWMSVPTEAVSDRTDSPTGKNYVTHIQRVHWINGVPVCPRVLCLCKAPECNRQPSWPLGRAPLVCPKKI
jgi:hypothetical protein